VFHRPLVLVSGLTLGDYLLWNWSLNHSHGLLALASGLTLPPLAVACIWLLVLALARLIARSSRRSRVSAGDRLVSAEKIEPAFRAGAPAAPSPGEQLPAPGSPAHSSGKLAA
jgi:hypothetical protein